MLCAFLGLRAAVCCWTCECAHAGEDEGRLWVFNYFFYNRKLKKILYISCRGTSKVLPQDTSDMQGYSYYTEDDDEVVGNMEDLV
jgi:hypothetical protein